MDDMTCLEQIFSTTTMKRKLDSNNVPTVANEIPEDGGKSAFADLNLDSRLLQAVAKLNFRSPTLVQRKAIPLALDGKDVLARAKTGSGKTAAYLLPVLHSLLKKKKVRMNSEHHRQEGFTNCD